MQSIHVIDRFNGAAPQIVVHETEVPNFEARLAIDLVARWGMISGDEGGEDSQGRAKARLMTPEEVVDRACRTAELLATAIRERNWFSASPTWEEAIQQAKRKYQETEAAEEADPHSL